MYIDKISLSEFRSFRQSSIDFVHSDMSMLRDCEHPKIKNMNLVLGSNGSGKTTLLKGIALALLGPAVTNSGLFPYHLIRRNAGRPAKEGALIKACLTLNDQDRKDNSSPQARQLESRIRIGHRGDLERLKWDHPEDSLWNPIYSKSSDAFFFVGYGTNRRVEKVEHVDLSRRRASSFERTQRIMSLFDEGYSLLPLSHWLPRYETENPDRCKQVRILVNRLIGRGRYRFTGQMEDGEYIFQRGKIRVPFPALSDGYQAFIGWIGDLLYHVCKTCPTGKKLNENQGIVMIDEVDLHIHPVWQIELLPRLARCLPRLQFIVTSHSPLLVSSLEMQNIIVMKQGRSSGSFLLKRAEVDTSRMDADQILLTELFGLESTRSMSQTDLIRDLIEKATEGDTNSAERLMRELSG